MSKPLSNIIFTIIFIGLISTPIMTMLLSQRLTTSTSEKRDLKAWVAWQKSESLAHYFTGISEYVQDHFGLRDDLITLNTKILFALNESPADTVINGKEDWLFYKTYDPLSILSSDKTKVISAVERRARHVSYRARVLSENGIAYVYTIAPNKMALYIEKMPNIYALSQNNRVYSLFNKSLEKNAVPFYLDLQKHLKKQQKKNHEFDFYYRNDTHWNHFGAYIAYKGIVTFIKETHPNLEVSLATYSFSAKEKRGGDLARFIGLNNGLKAFEPSTEFSDCAKYSRFIVQDGLLKAHCNTNKTIALLIGDSFRTNLYPFVAQSVGTLYVAKQGTSHQELDDIIKTIQPDLVIEEMVQRNLSKYLPY